MDPDDFIDEYLAHHGVKGQKWGVRRDRELLSKGAARVAQELHGASDAVTRYTSALEGLRSKPVSSAQAKKNLVENQTKFANKFQPQDASQKKGLSTDQKIAIGEVAAVGLILGYGAIANRRALGKIVAQAGKEISATDFNKNVSFSKSKTWMQGQYITKEALERPEFTIPAGHTFHRISTVAESKMETATYATSTIDDFNRYVAGFRSEKVGATAFHHITFEASKPVKVPSLPIVLDTLKSVLPEGTTDETTLKFYHNMSGGNWLSEKGSTTDKFIRALQAKGYGAIVDEMDAGVIGDTPLVVFSKAATNLKSTPISNADIKKAEGSLVELTHRKVSIG